MIVGTVLLFVAISVVTPLIFFSLVKFVGKFFNLTVDKDSWLKKRL